MKLNSKTLEKLRLLITEETEYRTGPQIIDFFSQFSHDDTYREGFPSRWKYTDSRLEEVNGTPEMESCIRLLLAPINFVGDFAALDEHISQFNQYLSFDGYRINRKGNFLTIEEVGLLDEIEIDEFDGPNTREIILDGLILSESEKENLESRSREFEKNIVSEAPLSAIFNCGGILEGVLDSLARSKPEEFNRSIASPKDSDGKAKHFDEWKLANLIDVALETGWIDKDAHKASHDLRDYRNYMHPRHQLKSAFNPDMGTVNLCHAALVEAISDIVNRLELEGE